MQTTVFPLTALLFRVYEPMCFFSAAYSIIERNLALADGQGIDIQDGRTQSSANEIFHSSRERMTKTTEAV
jgi:hypothetical protein